MARGPSQGELCPHGWVNACRDSEGLLGPLSWSPGVGAGVQTTCSPPPCQDEQIKGRGSGQGVWGRATRKRLGTQGWGERLARTRTPKPGWLWPGQQLPPDCTLCCAAQDLQGARPQRLGQLRTHLWTSVQPGAAPRPLQLLLGLSLGPRSPTPGSAPPKAFPSSGMAPWPPTWGSGQSQDSP